MTLKHLTEANRSVDTLIREIQMARHDASMALTVSKRQFKEVLNRIELHARKVELRLEAMTRDARPASFGEMQALEAGEKE